MIWAPPLGYKMLVVDVEEIDGCVLVLKDGKPAGKFRLPDNSLHQQVYELFDACGPRKYKIIVSEEPPGSGRYVLEAFSKMEGGNPYADKI